MRLWSLHPRYLDARGLVALWREALLAKKVLEGKTRGYRHHPQLIRFKQQKNPHAAISAYLLHIHAEATSRGYYFDARKIGRNRRTKPIPVTAGQRDYEWRHLKTKLKERDETKYRQLLRAGRRGLHPLFRLIRGDVEAWEKVRGNMRGNRQS